MPSGAAQKLFGTDGIRGEAGAFPLDENTVALIGRSLVSILAREPGRQPRIVIGRDTRKSGPDIERALASGAIAGGARVISAGVITTPGVAYVTRTGGFDAGVVISASHNPYRDNGIKIFSSSGKKIADEVERLIEEDLAAADRFAGAAQEPATRRPEASDGYENREDHYRQQYVNYLVEDVGRRMSLGGLRLGLDCANGAASALAPTLFKSLGARVEVINASPDGRNINEACGSLHLDGLRRIVVERELDLGVAFDGDADRALFVDSGGALVDGDAVILALADYLKSRGLLAGNIVVTTVMSNIGLELALRERSIEMVRTQVGDRYVLEELLARGGKLGGEQSGHIIFPDISLAGDGMITALELLRVIRDTGQPMSALAAQMTKFPQVLVNVRVRSKPPLDSLPEVKAETDQLEAELRGRGRLLVRYSGTENLARVMIEGEDQAKIEERANHLASVIRDAIGE
ncbi:MAG TPA: phosphoglucosamine mutase [Blastocatellia bacterium]|jgi:phosphoglucosamine mutase|nr:phosphoglucosamine mutase [Blastocatellia bacterium]